MAVGDRLAARLTVGTDGQVLTADSTQASMLNWATVPALLTTGYRLKRVTVITATGTWPRDSDVVAGWVMGWGGGGGGGGADNDVSGEVNMGRAGTGGGYCESFLEGLSANVSVTVGAGGAGGGATGTDGGNGGNTTFGAFFTAGGGVGGAGFATGGTGVIAFQVFHNGGTATGGNVINLKGGEGTFGIRTSGNAGVSGSSGASPRGGDAVRGVLQGTAGIDGNAPGGGASGGCADTTTGKAGGDGANGLIIVFELMR